jgi:hypothetical protein
VEIHQESTGSSDVSFDFELIGNLVGGPPRLNLTRFGDDFVLHWTDPAARLETTDILAPNATWTPVAGATSPVTISPTTTPVFLPPGPIASG